MGVMRDGGLAAGWAVLALVMDCHSRELLGWHLSRSGKSKSEEAALEQALIARYGTLGRVPKPFLLRSDNGLVFTSRSYTKLVRGYDLRQEFITPHTPEQNGMVERLIRTPRPPATTDAIPARSRLT
jgi:putative transposase